MFLLLSVLTSYYFWTCNKNIAAKVIITFTWLSIRALTLTSQLMVSMVYLFLSGLFLFWRHYRQTEHTFSKTNTLYPEVFSKQCETIFTTDFTEAVTATPALSSHLAVVAPTAFDAARARRIRSANAAAPSATRSLIIIIIYY